MGLETLPNATTKRQARSGVGRFEVPGQPMYILRPGASEDQAHGAGCDVELTWNDMNLREKINKTIINRWYIEVFFVLEQVFFIYKIAFAVHSMLRISRKFIPPTPPINKNTGSLKQLKTLRAGFGLWVFHQMS